MNCPETCRKPPKGPKKFKMTVSAAFENSCLLTLIIKKDKKVTEHVTYQPTLTISRKSSINSTPTCSKSCGNEPQCPKIFKKNIFFKF